MVTKKQNQEMTYTFIEIMYHANKIQELDRK